MLDEGEILLSQSGLPLAARRSLGYGEVIFLAFDPSLEPLRSWDGLQELYRRLLDHPVGKTGLGLRLPGLVPGRERCVYNPHIGLPSAWWVAGFLGLYVIAIGPAIFPAAPLQKRELACPAYPFW